MKPIFALGTAALALFAGPGPARPAELPPKMTYLFFVEGKPAGSSEITTTLKNGVYLVSSTEDVAFTEFSQRLTCRTELDARTLRARSFHYEGTRNGESMSGTVRIEGKAALGEMKTGETSYDGSTAWGDSSFFFQNYVPEHLVLISRFVAKYAKPQTKVGVVFPSDMMATSAAAGLESEIEIPTRPRPSVCVRYAVAFQNSAPFYLFVDPERSVPVYMIFPATKTEIFLKEAFGDRPTPNYRAQVAPESE
jgi:hypothetical protein